MNLVLWRKLCAASPLDKKMTEEATQSLVLGMANHFMGKPNLPQKILNEVICS